MGWGEDGEVCVWGDVGDVRVEMGEGMREEMESRSDSAGVGVGGGGVRVGW